MPDFVHPQTEDVYKHLNVGKCIRFALNPKFAINKIIIWDDQKKSNNIIGELRFNTPVLNVKIKMDRLIGVCQTKIFIFNLNTLETLDMFDTFDNINGNVLLLHKGTADT